jgi:hypothetical protein
LAKTWKNVPKKSMKTLEQFKAMLEPVVLRHSLSSLPLPYLPPLRKLIFLPFFSLIIWFI